MILSLLLLVLHIFLQIKKRDADLFGTVELSIPPTCRVTIWSKVSQDTEEYLSYTVPLIGIYSDDVDEICIQRFVETSNTSGILYCTITVIMIIYFFILIESSGHPTAQSKASATPYHTIIDTPHIG